MTAIRAIGLMSGTSLDGVDAALIETDGEGAVRRGPSIETFYAEAERATLRAALAAAVGMTDRTARPAPLAEAERLTTRAHGDAVLALCARHGVALETVDVVGFHGQTVWHDPKAGITVQLGDGAALARRLGRPVVSDFRAADVAAGGEGAPLVPVYHRALALASRLAGPVCVVNIGGVANVTYLDGEAEPLACDVGPGNALIDDFLRARLGLAMDEDGRFAAAGEAEERLLASWLRRDHFAKAYPKSLDRNAFAEVASSVEALPTADGAATLTAFTARAIAASARLWPAPPARWIVCGGGARNPTLMAMLEACVDAPVTAAEALGWSSAAMEAEAFAYLAVRALKGLPLSFPGTTGAPEPLTGGVLALPG